MKSVFSYEKHQGLVFLRDLSNWNHLDDHLKTVTDAEKSLEHDSAQYHSERAKLDVRQLVKSAEACESEPQSMHQGLYQALQDQPSFQRYIYQDEQDEESRTYFDNIRVLYPKDDMKRIERKSGCLVNEVFSWILDCPQYNSLTGLTLDESESQSQLLWIKGVPAMGKTMPAVGIIRQLSGQLADLTPSLSYYFYQGTDEQAQNSATAIIGSLIWMLLAQ